MTLADPVSSVAAPAPADDRDTDTRPSEYDRFLEALRPAVMGPRLATALGGGPDRCHVLDAKLEPGVRAMVLYEHGPRLVRGDVIPSEVTTPSRPRSRSPRGCGCTRSRTTPTCRGCPS